MTFREFIRSEDPEFFEGVNIDEWISGVLKSALEVGRHHGDCVKIPGGCMLCLLESKLKDYREKILKK